MLDGLLLHGSGLKIYEHYVDTGGATDHVFALSHLLGYRFVPRLRDLADRRLGTFEPATRYKELEPLMGRPINTDIILECWDEVVRLAASLKAKTVAPSVMLKKLSAYQRQNRLDFALQEIGRIERALFTLDWLESKDLRRRCLAGLNKSEARHSLAGAVFTQKQGRLTDRTVESQEFRASGLNLVTAAIVYWNTLYMDRAVNHLRAAGQPAPDDLLAHVRAPRLEPYQLDGGLPLERTERRGRDLPAAAPQRPPARHRLSRVHALFDLPLFVAQTLRCPRNE